MSLHTAFSAQFMTRFVAAILLMTFSVGHVGAEALKIEATLVWATNDDKEKKNHKALDESLAKELKEVFQWKYYFEIRKTNDVVPDRGTKIIDISKKCRLEITELVGPTVEVQVIGEGKPVNKTRKPLKRGEFFTIGGGDKEGGAWFVVVRQLDK